MVIVVTAFVREVPFPHELEGMTPIVPDTVPVVTAMLLVPWPAVIDHP
jgi:hypothetical protein